jgi:hypothetical protein
MIPFVLQLPFLFLPYFPAVLTEPPRSRSTSGLGVVWLISLLSSAVRYTASQRPYSAFWQLPAILFLRDTLLQNNVYILQLPS